LNTFNELIGHLSDKEGRSALKGMYRGIEREALRIESSGELATNPHPQALGSALTNSRITTDYSESLLEFITPVFNDVDALLQDLTYTHAFSVQNLDNQRLWPVSMPCYIGEVKDISIADYGSSNHGQMKRLYRKGLTYRYGALMQIISGVHFNFSVSEPLWDRLYDLSGSQLTKDEFISDSYFGLIRNYRRMVWMLPYLFGASPALCRSFLQGQTTNIAFETLGKDTLYLPYATSLRMSDLGYTNKEQDKLNVSYDSLAQYLEGMYSAIHMPSANFAKIGVKVDGEYRQLNANVLQIENEFYAPIRPKRVAFVGEKPSEALARAGVEYIEVRALDVNPYSPIGIDASQVRFLDLFILHCLLDDSATSDDAQEAESTANLMKVVMEGRKPGLELSRDGEVISLKAWMHEMFAQLAKLAELLDDEGEPHYQNALDKWLAAVENTELTLSGQVLKELKESGIDHAYWVLNLANKYHQEFIDNILPDAVEAQYRQAVKDSLAQQHELESESTQSFEAYLKEYFKDDPSYSDTKPLAKF